MPSKKPKDPRGGKRIGSGRKKKAVALQKLEGPVGKRPNHDEIPFEKIAAPPEPPAWLNKYAREYWIRHAPQLVLMGILTTVSLSSFAMLADAWGQFREADENLSLLVVSTARGESPSPWLKVKNDAGKIFHSLAAAFQVLPSTATIATPPGKDVPKGDFSTAGGANLRVAK